MRRLPIVIAILFSPTVLLGAPAGLPGVREPDPLPVAARRAIDRYDKAVAAAKKAYDEAVAKAAAAARKDLEPIMEAETKAGRLESAMAVKLQIDLLNTQIEVAAKVIPDVYLNLADKIENGKLTDQEWKTLPGVKVNADAKGVTETKVFVRKGEAWLVAPCPSDQWKGGPNEPPMDYRGDLLQARAIYPEFMKMYIRVDNQQRIMGYIAEGEGQITLNPRDHYPNDNSGTITVKLLRIR